MYDNGQNILLAKKHNMGVIGIRSHAAGALTPAVDRPIPLILSSDHRPRISM